MSCDTVGEPSMYSLNRRTAVLGSVIVMGAMLSLVSCSGQAVEIFDDSSLDRRLSAIAESGGSARLGSLVGSKGETIRIFSKDSWTKDALEDEVHQELEMPDYYLEKGSIILLLRDRRVVRGISIIIYLPPGSYESEAIVKRDDATKELRIIA